MYPAKINKHEVTPKAFCPNFWGHFNSDASYRFGIGKCQNESFNLGRGKPRFYNSLLKKNLLSLKKSSKALVQKKL